MGRFTRNSRGAALVEFAIVVLLLLTLVFGIIEFGLLIKDYLAIHQAAREGARTAAIGETTSAIIDRVIASSPITDVSPSDVSIDKKTVSSGGWIALGDDGSKNDAAPGDYIRVAVRMRHRWITGFFSSSLTPVRAEMTIRRE